MKRRRLISFITVAAMVMSLFALMPQTASAEKKNEEYYLSSTFTYDWYNTCGITGPDDPNNPVVITINNSNNSLKNSIAVSGEGINGGLHIKSGYVRITGGSVIASIYRVRSTVAWVYNGPLITVHSGATLILDNVTVTGKPTWGDDVEAVSAAIINYGTLNIGNGVTVCDNNYFTAEIDYGGGIFNSGTLNMSGGTISGNDANYGGGVYTTQAGTFNMSGGTISNNNSRGHGGGVCNEGTATIDGGKITGNTSNNNSGGGICNSGSGTLNILSGTISNNDGYSGGGVFNNEEGKLNISGGTITYNTCTYGGGGVFNKNNGTLHITNATIEHNTSGYYGGGVYNDGVAIIEGGKISSNSSEEYGGGVFNTALGTLTISDGEISSNSSAYRGGGVYNKGTATIDGGTILNNKANYGGGVYTLNSATTTIEGGGISGNTAEQNGGGIYNNGATIIEGGEIYNNTAKKDGGGVCNDVVDDKSGTTTINGGVIYGNTAVNGGAQFFNAATGSNFAINHGLIVGTRSGTYSSSSPAKSGSVSGAIGETVTTASGLSAPIQAGDMLIANPADGIASRIDGSISDAAYNSTTKVWKFAISVTEITLDKTTANVDYPKQSSLTLTPTVSPANAADKTVTWASSNTRVASVSGGAVTIKAAGSATISATTVNGLSASCLITVTNSAYTIAYNKKGGTITNESNYTSYTYGTGKTLPTPIREGYTFDGWFVSSVFTGTAVTSISATDTGNKIYYAKWTARSYFVTLNVNGGTCEALTSYTYGVGAVLPIPTREGYTFDGWFANSSFTGTSVSYIPATETAGDKSYWAKWTENPPTEFSVTYEGGVVTVSSPRAGTFQLIFASYNAKALKGIKIVPITFTAQGKQTPAVPTDFNTQGATRCDIMLWDDMENIKPLCAVCTMQ